MEFRSHSFGISIAPHHFTKIMRVPVALLRRLGIRLIIYLDDILILNQSKVDIMSDLSTVLSLLEGLGFLINHQKSVMQPTQQMEFLGYTVNSISMTLSLPREKVVKIIDSCKRLLNAERVSARDLAKVIRQLTATNQAVLPDPLHYRSLQVLKTRALHMGGHCDQLVTLDQEAKSELLWWSVELEQWNGKALLNPEPHITIQSDSSLQGWGGQCLKIPE